MGDGAQEVEPLIFNRILLNIGAVRGVGPVGLEVNIKRGVKDVFDAIASEFDLTRRIPWEECLLAVEGLKEGSLILDVGCGNGRNVFFLAERGYAVLALDFSINLLRMVRGRALKMGLGRLVYPVMADACHLPFKKGGLNGVVSFAVLHHIPTKGLRIAAAREAARVLKGNGRIVLSVWSRWQLRHVAPLVKGFLMKLKGRLFEFGDVYIPWRKGGAEHLRFYHLFTPGELKKTVEGGGLKVKALFKKSFKKKFFAENFIAIGAHNVCEEPTRPIRPL